jgi:transaldolase
MPPKVAAAGRLNLKGNFTSRLNENYPVDMTDIAKDSDIEKFWEVDEKVVSLAEKLSEKVPLTGDELIERAHDAGCEDMFPFLTPEESIWIDKDGKIPVYERWEKMIKDGKIGPDTLLTLAGLASFTADQGMLDNRIKGIID